LRNHAPPRKSSIRNSPLYGGVVVSPSPPSTGHITLEGGWMREQTFGETTDPFNAHETKNTDYRFLEAPAFYDDLLIEYYENEWYSWLVDQLVAALFSGYDFLGPGAEEVRTFFEKTCPDARDQVRTLGINVVREGTGGMRKFTDDKGQLRQIYSLNGRLIRLKEGPAKTATQSGKNAPAYKVQFDSNNDPIGVVDTAAEHSDTNTEVDPEEISKYITRMTIQGVNDWKADFTEWPRISPLDYRHPEVALCRIHRDRWSPYGLRYGHACFHVIKSMRSLNRDLIAAIKRLSATLLVFKGDVDHLGTDAEKRAAILAATDAFKDMDSATTGVVGIDARNTLGFPEGSRTERLIAIMDQLEPVMSALLLNFLVPLGIVEQTGANKSLIAKQEIRARRQLREDQGAVSRFFETQIFPDITDKECKMVFDTELDPEFWIKLWETSAVSRERITQEFSIIDATGTYANDLSIELAEKTAKAQPPPTTGSSSGGSNSDDSGMRKGGKADTSVSKGGA